MTPRMGVIMIGGSGTVLTVMFLLISIRVSYSHVEGGRVVRRRDANPNPKRIK